MGQSGDAVTCCWRTLRPEAGILVLGLAISQWEMGVSDDMVTAGVLWLFPNITNFMEWHMRARHAHLCLLWARQCSCVSIKVASPVDVCHVRG